MTTVDVSSRGTWRGEGPLSARAPDHPTATINVGDLERAGLALLGGTLIALGLRRRSVGGLAAAIAGGGLLYRAATGHYQLYERLGIDTAGHRQEVAGAPNADVEAVASITIGKPAEELDRLWRDPKTQASILGNFAEVAPAGEGRWHWKVHSPVGRVLEWESRVVADQPGQVQRWESVEGAALPNEGEIRFRPAPAGRGTEVRLRVRFDPPGGAIGGAVAKLLGFVPRLMASRTLHYFKSLAETGEIPTTEHQPAARADTR